MSNQPSDDSVPIAVQILDELVASAFVQVDFEPQKHQRVAFHVDILKLALKDILDVYDKPKPPNDYSHVIEGWKRDKPAKPSKPDSLIKFQKFP